MSPPSAAQPLVVIALSPERRAEAAEAARELEVPLLINVDPCELTYPPFALVGRHACITPDAKRPGRCRWIFSVVQWTTGAGLVAARVR